jgi:hypothetical protein
MVAGNWYARPGNSLSERARSILANSKIPAMRKLIVDENSFGIVLRGQVHLYYYKQLAQELVRNEFEDIAIVNHIEVVDSK